MTTGHPEAAARFVANDEGTGWTQKWIFALGGGMLNVIAGGPNLIGDYYAQTPFTPTPGTWPSTPAI